VIWMALAALAVLGWYVSRVLWPLRKCPACGGSGRIHGHGDTRRVCRRCGGTKEVRRFGARRED
jgi:ribosomal protein S27AE